MKKSKMSEDRNPRNELRPKDGRGKGVGMSGGNRDGRNAESCPDSGQGFGKGKGRGRGTNR